MERPDPPGAASPGPVSCTGGTSILSVCSPLPCHDWGATAASDGAGAGGSRE